MKGKKTFTHAEVAKIKKLIAEKGDATPDKQKEIRYKIRKIGFYYSEFYSTRVIGGYTVNEFESLIRSGKIIVKD